MAKQNLINKIAVYSADLFTATGAPIALFSILSLFDHNYKLAFILHTINLLIDSLDGTYARIFHKTSSSTKYDGATMDNIIDYITYVLFPAILIFQLHLVPDQLVYLLTGSIMLTSAFQFSQNDAKTSDHFFKGFPSYWDLVVFYIYLFNLNQVLSAIIIFIFCILIFIPIKYIYPSRPEYVSQSKLIQTFIKLSTLIYLLSITYLLIIYPLTNIPTKSFVISFTFVYLYASLFRTFKPLVK